MFARNSSNKLWILNKLKFPCLGIAVPFGSGVRMEWHDQDDQATRCKDGPAQRLTTPSHSRTAHTLSRYPTTSIVATISPHARAVALS